MSEGPAYQYRPYPNVLPRFRQSTDDDRPLVPPREADGPTANSSATEGRRSECLPGDVRPPSKWSKPSRSVSTRHHHMTCRSSSSSSVIKGDIPDCLTECFDWPGCCWNHFGRMKNWFAFDSPPPLPSRWWQHCSSWEPPVAKSSVTKKIHLKLTWMNHVLPMAYWAKKVYQDVYTDRRTAVSIWYWP